MGALARLSAPVADVEPGQSVNLALSVRNTGTVVDQFSFEALGPVAAWTTFDTPTVSLFPQAEETVQVIFSPPRAPETTPGALPFGIRVVSREDPEGSMVEEGTLNVAAFSEVTAELSPRATRMRSRGKLQVLVDNRSNVAYRADLAGTDASTLFDYGFRPPLVDAAPGSVAFSRVSLRARHRYWRGPATTQPFQVLLRQPDRGAAAGGPDRGAAGGPDSGQPAGGADGGPHPPELAADGAVLRDPILPAWLPKALAALAALVLLLVLLWFKLVKPQITAAAQNQVTKALKPIEHQIHQLQSGPPPTTAAGGGPTTTTVPAGTTTTVVTTRAVTTTSLPQPTSTPTTVKPKPPAKPVPAVKRSPVNASLTISRDNATAFYSVPSRNTLEVTDILIQNSAGASGNLYLKRNGTVLMSWAMANFRDLDYHWITPIYFGPRSQLQLTLRDCRAGCTPALYYAGALVSSP